MARAPARGEAEQVVARAGAAKSTRRLVALMLVQFWALKKEVARMETMVVEWVQSFCTKASICWNLYCVFRDLLLKIAAAHWGSSNSIKRYSPQQFEAETLLFCRIADELSQVSTPDLSLATRSQSLGTIRRELLLQKSSGQITETALKEIEACEEQRFKMIRKEKQLEAAAEAMRVRVREIDRERKRIEEAASTLRGVMANLENNELCIQENLRSEGDVARAKLVEAQAEARKQLKLLSERKQATLDDYSGSFRQKQRSHDQMEVQLENDMMSTESSFAGNHVVFLMDGSHSMHGARWAAALSALDAFTLACTGAADRMSLITFSHTARSIMTNAPISSYVPGSLAFPGGGTSYHAAWSEAAECMKLTSNGMRVITVFMTDGEADTRQAAAIAQQLHKRYCSGPEGGFITFVVSLGDDFDRKILEPIVLAGNGCQSTYTFCDEKVALQVHASTSTLAREFKKLAEHVSRRESWIKSRLDFVSSQRESHRDQHQIILDHLDRMYERFAQSSEQVQKSIKDGLEADSEDMVRLMKNQLNTVREDKFEVQNRLDDLMSLKEKLAAEKANLQDEKIATIEQDLEEARENRQRLIRVFNESEALEIDKIEKKLHTEQSLLQSMGFLLEGDAAKVVEAVDGFRNLQRSITIGASDANATCNNIARMARTTADTLQRPVRLELQDDSKADFVFEFYKHFVGLDIRLPMRNVENFRVIVKHIAKQGGTDIDRRVVDRLTSTFECRELFVGDDEGVEALQERSKAKLKTAILSKEPRGRKLTEAIRKHDVKKKQLQDELDRVEDRITECKSAKKRDDKALSSLEREREKLEGKIDSEKQMKVDKEQERDEFLADYHLDFLVLKRLTEDLNQAFNQQMAREENFAVCVNLATAVKNVMEPMKGVIKAASDCRQAVHGENNPASRRIQLGATVKQGMLPNALADDVPVQLRCRV
ncbi:unnamed protein product [Prorocentrum cordatum]|uniref:VWFA domain-containing protein n=1 Tax=Prorocentrum cordatum TaxID=2364126 RepID=A0ABN9WJA2_9DINO|nr:unnamed protein product [Polarella glacialis]